MARPEGRGRAVRRPGGCPCTAAVGCPSPFVVLRVFVCVFSSCVGLGLLSPGPLMAFRIALSCCLCLFRFCRCFILTLLIYTCDYRACQPPKD